MDGTNVSERERRIGENETLFRSVNEQVQALEESFATPADLMHALCECGTETCLERIQLHPREYERVRSNPLHFVVRPAHVFPDTEDPVEKTDRYWIVQKREGLPARLARESDPR